MRVAVYHDLPPGGALRMLAETLRRLRHHDLHLFEIDRGDGEGDARAALPGCVDSVRRVPHALAGLPGGRLEPATAVAQAVATETRIAAAIDTVRYDVAMVHPSMHLQSPWLLAALQTPSLYFAQEPRRLSFEKGYIAARGGNRRRPSPRRVAAQALERSVRRRDRRAMLAATTVACNSSFTAEAIYRAYGRSALVCHLGVDRALFIPGETPRAVPGYVLVVGALDPVKGHDMVVEALALIPPESRPLLRIAYERAVPGEAERLGSLASQRGVELHLHHRIDDAALVALYRGAAATVCASRLEPFGLTALESLSAGTPVVAIAEGGFRETMRDGEGGVLVAPTAEALAAGIGTVIDTGLCVDPLRIRATVSDFTWDRTAACVDAALLQAASGTRT